MAGWKNPFRRPKIQHPDGLDSTYYTAGITFDNGAEHLAYHNDRPHPLINAFDGFIPQRQLLVTNPQVVYQMNSLPVVTILPGIVAGQNGTQPLLQNGELDQSSPNNQLVSQSLFGGVQP